MCFHQYVVNLKSWAIKIANLLNFPIVKAIKPSGVARTPALSVTANCAERACESHPVKMQPWTGNVEPCMSKGNKGYGEVFVSVSFQQSSIYAIRSFSASFPGRRSSMASAFAGKANRATMSTDNQPIQENLQPTMVLGKDDRMTVKRRLQRAKSAPIEHG